VYDLIDMMQGEFSTAVGGSGFPDWMALTSGAPNTREPFAGGYLNNPAEEAVWNNLWANAPANDGTGLQDHYARGLRRLAHAFAGAPGLLALEILNEPWPGSSWAACFGQAGCPPGGFDQTSLTSFYRRIIHALRRSEAHHLIAYEPNLLFDFASSTRLGALGDGNLLFAFHNYCLANAPGLPPNPALSASCAMSENGTFNNAETRARDGGGALLMDEWGNTTDLTRAERMAREADQHMVGWTVWAYEDCCGSPAAIVKDGSRPPTAPGNLNLSELNALARPYPKLVAGTPTSWSYDSTSDVFALTYSPRPVAGGRFPAGADTQIELPALHYPTGYTVRVTGAPVLSAPDANLLRLGKQPGAGTVQVTVTPAPHHASAAGPFVWPTAAASTASADCPAQARHAVQIRYGLRDARVVRVLVYLDGQHVATTHGHRILRIELPAGLADGSVIRLVASTARGQQITATRRLHGCSLSPAGAWTIYNR
jgi:endoglycosylceramidase